MSYAHEEISLKLSSYDHNSLDSTVRELLMELRAVGASCIGPIPLPVERQKFIVNRSPHIDKKSREQFAVNNHRRLIIVVASESVLDSLSRFIVSSGIHIEVKIRGSNIGNASA